MSYNDLKKILNEYNWDDGFEIPKKILSNQDCDLALALEIFYLADGFAYLEGFVKESKLEEWEQFIRNSRKLIPTTFALIYFNQS